MTYPYYQNNQYYMQDLQNMRDKIDRQMQQMQQMNQNQMQQQPVPTNLTQTFQLAPQINSNSELQCQYVNNIDEVKGIFVMKTGVFLNKELNTLWIKNTNGDIRTFELSELVEIDPKDREIAILKQEIEKMKEMISNESNVNNTDNDGADESKKSARIPVRKQSNAK